MVDPLPGVAVVVAAPDAVAGTDFAVLCSINSGEVDGAAVGADGDVGEIVNIGVNNAKLVKGNGVIPAYREG